MDETRWWPAIGLAFGTAVGFAGAFGGFSAFLIVAVLGLLGLVIGRALTGDLDVGALLGSRRRS